MNRHPLYLTALTGRADVYHVVGAMKSSLADYKSALQFSRDSEHKRDILASMGRIYSELGDYDQEMRCAKRLIRVASKMDICSKGKALMKKADAMRDKGKFKSSLRLAVKAVSLYNTALRKTERRGEDLTIQASIADAYNTMGMVNNLQGKYGSALMFFKKSLKVFRKMNNQIAIAHALNNIGLTYWFHGRFDEARDYFKRSLEIAQKIGYKNVEAIVLGNMGLIYSEEKPRIALEYYKKAIMISDAIGNRANTGSNLNNMGLCYANMCDYPNAIIYYNRSLCIFRKISYKYGAAMTLHNIGMVCFDRGDYKKALAYENEAEKVARGANVMETIIRCFILKAQVFRVQKKYLMSMQLLKKSIGLAGKYEMNDLLRVAAKQYVKAAVEEGTGKYMRDISKYIALLAKFYRNATSDDTRCGLLIILIKYDIAEKKYDDAGEKVLLLSQLAAKLGDKYLTAEALFARVQLYSAIGKGFLHHLHKLKELINQSGFYFLLDELKKYAGSNLDT